MSDSERRITELDGIRGIAALGVVFFHYHRHNNVQPLDFLFHPLYESGGYFVNLFFVLSGFILSQVYVYDARYPSMLRATQTRIARLYPLHLLTLIVVAVLMKVHVLLAGQGYIYPYNDGYHFLLNLLMLNDSGLQSGYSFNGPSWSISTEFLINLVFIAVALTSPSRSAWLGCALVLGTLAIQSQAGWVEVPRAFRPYHDMIRCAQGFGVGLALRTLHERTRSRALPRWLLESALVVVAAGITYLMCNREWKWTVPVLNFVFFPALIILSLRSSHVGGVFRSKPVVHLGHISFSVYLLHFPLELVEANIGRRLGTPLPVAAPAMLLLHVGGVILLAHLTWKWFEVPSRRYINQVGRGPKPAPR